MQYSKSLIHSGFHRAGENFSGTGLPDMSTPNAPGTLTSFAVPHSPTNDDVIAASQGVH